MSDPETRFKLTLHYDGSAFHGWQLQPGQPTVQGALEAAAEQLTGSRRPVIGAGRTDTGVHAKGQVAAVTMPSRWEAAALARSLNALLPDSLWIECAEPVPADFHPRFGATSRSYEYRVGTAARTASPFHRRGCWPHGAPFDLDAAGRTAQVLVGVHDFGAFAKSGQPQRGHTCHVTRARWRPWKDLGAVFEITANRFLHRMVRYLVGTMVDIARHRRSEEEMALLLSGETDLTTSPPAPPQGLCLTRVDYADTGTVTPQCKRKLPIGKPKLTCWLAPTALVTLLAACEPSSPDAVIPEPVSASASIPASTAASPGQSLSDSRATAIVRAARTVAPSVVAVSVRRRQQVRRRSFFDDYFLPFRESRGLGSGFVVDGRGTVLTNHHVIAGATEILVTLPDGRDFDAALAGSDPATDVAVLTLDGAAGLPVAPLGTASDLLIGEWTVAIGNPFGGLISNPEPSVTAGVVSALGRHIIPGEEDDGFYLGMIQTDASINPGNSGGPLVNAVGEVIGMNTSILSRSGGSEGLGFAIPIDRALKVARDLVEHGEVQRAWLGLGVDAVEADGFGRSRGVRVARVTPGSPAAAAGIREGSRLLRAGSSRMATPLDYTAVLLDLRAGDRIELALEGMGAVQLQAAPLPSAAADRVELLRDLEVVTVTPGIQAERRLASAEGALVVEISDALARRIGLAAGDVLLAVNNRRLRTAREAADELRRTQRSGRSFVLLFERSGRMVRTGLLEWR
ncbi:MAG: tRNA pseudouridine(38-40) synthase TruA [Gemmatimonadota bacterium]|nr:tRNA pseudouridine(38-40) synthase TruA [Gemmatimonadota bacterium]